MSDIASYLQTGENNSTSIHKHLQVSVASKSYIARTIEATLKRTTESQSVTHTEVFQDELVQLLDDFDEQEEGSPSKKVKSSDDFCRQQSTKQ